MESISILYAVLPFVTGIVFKLIAFTKVGDAQKNAIKKMLQERKTEDNKPLLTDRQIEVVVSVANFATRSITAISALAASLLALLIVALKYPYPFVWGSLGVNVVLAVIVWAKVHTHIGTWEDIWSVPVGEFFMLMSFVIDAVGVVASIVGPTLAAR